MRKVVLTINMKSQININNSMKILKKSNSHWIIIISEHYLNNNNKNKILLSKKIANKEKVYIKINKINKINKNVYSEIKL